MGKSLSDYRKEAEEKGQRESLTQNYFSFVNPGDSLIGAFLYQESVVPNAEMGPCQRYVFQTEEGTTSCLLGQATDKQLEGKLAEGDLVTITFHGKQQIKGGPKSVNKFTVDKWGKMSKSDLKSFMVDVMPF